MDRETQRILDRSLVKIVYLKDDMNKLEGKLKKLYSEEVKTKNENKK